MANETLTLKRSEQRMNHHTLESSLGVTGKLTPQALDFEMAVLGAILINADAVGEVVDFLSPRMFYKEAHFHIYKAIVDLFNQAEPIDLLTVTSHLRKSKFLDVVGGPSYLASLTNRVASSANIEYHARIVMEKFVLRELINNCNSIIKDAYDDSKDVLQLLDKAETNLFGIIQENFKRDSKELNIVMKKALEELMAMKNTENQFHGVPSGIRSIDEKTGGWQKSDLIIIAARPGMGKTSFVLSVARNAAIDYKRPVALFSLEMSSTQLVHRLFSIETGIPSEKIAKGKLSDDEWLILTNKLGPLNNANLIIDDTPALSVFDLRAKCRRLKHQQDIQLIIVDYLQLMQAGVDTERGKGNREQEISYISRSLKALAKDLNVPVIALSQLSREVEKRSASRRPQLSDLRESGSIEQDADIVMFIYRPEYYKLETFEDEVPAAGLADIMIQKNRHGGTEDIRIRFQSKYTRFTDIDATMGKDDSFSGITQNQSFDIIDSSMNSEYGDEFRSNNPLTDGIPY